MTLASKTSTVAASDARAIVLEQCARAAANNAYASARAAFASRAREDVVRAGDHFQHASTLYQRAADAWTARGEARRSFAEHCARMSARLAATRFAKLGLHQTFVP